VSGPDGGARPPAQGGDELGVEWLQIESLDLEGQGIAHDASGKVMFIDGALIGEQVRMRVTRTKNNWAKGEMMAMRRESSQRVTPACPHFGVCGGCKMQHLDVGAQVAIKQRALEDALWHVGKVKPEMVMRPISGPAWGYRQRARLSLFYLARERRMLIGFHESKSSHVADIGVCPVMPKAMSTLLGPLHALIAQLDQPDRLPQIEVAMGDKVIALVLRHLSPIGKRDLNRLREFGTEHGVQWWLQPKGPESARPLEMESTPLQPAAGAAPLTYTLPEFGISMPYRPTDFTQVNPAINRALVNRALQLLSPSADDRVIDWFCGMGNFTLPIARTARQVLGVEGSATLVAQAKSNAALHALASKVRFATADLFETGPQALAAFGSADKWLLDPPRDGAFALIKALVALHDEPALAPAFNLPARIVYVSCDPSTLARDASLLVHQAGYRCTAAGAVNMFPHTAHVESIAVFDRT
jgi:23S rRNA (uracil1939-C5)-methyltransferase